MQVKLAVRKPCIANDPIGMKSYRPKYFNSNLLATA